VELPNEFRPLKVSVLRDETDQDFPSSVTGLQIRHRLELQHSDKDRGDIGRPKDPFVPCPKTTELVTPTSTM